MKLLSAAIATLIASSAANAATNVYCFSGIRDRSETFRTSDRGFPTEYYKSNIAGCFSFDPSLSTLDSDGNRFLSLDLLQSSQQLRASVASNTLTLSHRLNFVAIETFTVSALFEDSHLGSAFPNTIDFSKIISSSYSGLTYLPFRSRGDPTSSSGRLTGLSASLLPGASPRMFAAGFTTTVVSGVPEPTT